MPLAQTLLLIQALIFGLMIGSFLNVCIYRIPLKLSILGRSFCPLCKKGIPLYRNVPVVSFVIQGGKSACCQKSIRLQYPTVELLTGLLSVATLLHSQSLAQYFIWFLTFIAPLIVISIIDLQLKIIPDIISLPFIGVGIAVRIYEDYPDGTGALQTSLIGIFVGGGALLLLAEIVSRLKKADAMGGGDIKLTAMLGAFLGFKPLIFIFFVSSVLALIYALISRLVKKSTEENPTIPFGPFLSIAAMIFWLYGKPITDWYFLGKDFGRNPFFP